MEILPISVIIPVRNMERTIEECLISVQRNSPAEIIVVDGNSSDRTVEIARRYTEKIYSDEGRGYTYALQFGAEQATQEYIAYVDADIVLPQGTLVTLLNELKAEGYANIQAKWLSASLDTYWERAMDFMVRHLGTREGQGGTSAAVMRRDTVLDVKFDPFFKISGGDYDFLVRLKKRGYKLGTSSASVYHHHRADLRSTFKHWSLWGWGYSYLIRQFGVRPKRLLLIPVAMVYFIVLCLIKGKPQFIPFVAVAGVSTIAGIVKGFAQLIGEALGRKQKSAQ